MAMTFLKGRPSHSDDNCKMSARECQASGTVRARSVIVGLAPCPGSATLRGSRR